MMTDHTYQLCFVRLSGGDVKSNSLLLANKYYIFGRVKETVLKFWSKRKATVQKFKAAFPNAGHPHISKISGTDMVIVILESVSWTFALAALILLHSI